MNICYFVCFICYIRELKYLNHLCYLFEPDPWFPWDPWWTNVNMDIQGWRQKNMKTNFVITINNKNRYVKDYNNICFSYNWSEMLFLSLNDQFKLFGEEWIENRSEKPKKHSVVRAVAKIDKYSKDWWMNYYECCGSGSNVPALFGCPDLCSAKSDQNNCKTT